MAIIIKILLILIGAVAIIITALIMWPFILAGAIKDSFKTN
jgi:hypothetical protein